MNDERPQDQATEPKPERVEPSFAPAEAAGEAKPPESGREQLIALIAQLETQIAELGAQRLRALADAENARKRALRDSEDTRRYAAAALARDVAPVADNMRRAIAAVPAEAAAADPVLANLLDGMQAIERSFLAALDQHGVRQIAATGVPFDPNLHQAMLQVETADQPAGTVVEVMQPGYVLHDRLLRPAMVSVAKAPAARPAPLPPSNGAALDTTA